MRAAERQPAIDAADSPVPERATSVAISLPAALRRGLWVAALLAPWALLIRRLAFFWAADLQYAYAWSVPCLGPVLAWLRLAGQPAHRPLRVNALLFAAAAAIFPLRLVQEAAPDWSAVNWAFALAVTLATFLFLCRTGGLRWACWFLFPLCFLLTSVPWPQRFDLWLTQALMRDVAALTVELLGWMNVPAFRQGNLVCLPAGPIGIDEACSGIRSLQAMFMASLFLGELCRLPARRRVLLVLAGLALAFAGNVFRTTLLSFIAAHEGLEAIHRWHDPAGFGVLFFGLAGAWALASWWRGPSEADPTSHAPALSLFPATIPAGLILVLLAGEGLVQGWYRLHEFGAPPPRRLTVTWPEQEENFHTLPVADSARGILLFSNAEAAAWRDRAGGEWCLYHFTWAPGGTSTQTLRQHGPETCLAAGGADLMRDLGVRAVSIPGGDLSFHEYLFRKDGAPLYVFFCLCEESQARRSPRAIFGDDGSGWAHLGEALAGERNLGQESIEIALRPSSSEADPVALVTLRLASVLAQR